MRDPLALAVAFNFLALVVVSVLWSTESRRGDRLAYEIACIRYDLGLPEPLPAPRWWQRARAWLRTVPEEDVTEDTVESEAVVIGGARVVGKTAPSKAADWVEDDLAAIRARTEQRQNRGVK